MPGAQPGIRPISPIRTTMDGPRNTRRDTEKGESASLPQPAYSRLFVSVGSVYSVDPNPILPICPIWLSCGSSLCGIREARG